MPHLAAHSETLVQKAICICLASSSIFVSLAEHLVLPLVNNAKTPEHVRAQILHPHSNLIAHVRPVSLLCHRDYFKVAWENSIDFENVPVTMMPLFVWIELFSVDEPLWSENSVLVDRLNSQFRSVRFLVCSPLSNLSADWVPWTKKPTWLKNKQPEEPVAATYLFLSLPHGDQSRTVFLTFIHWVLW